MRKITLLIVSIVFTTSFCFGQNLINNADFETGTPGDAVPSWSGFKNRIANDDIVPDQVGQIENGDGSLFQEITVTPGETYDVSLDYRWVGAGGAANANQTIRVKEVGNSSNNLTLTGATSSDGNTLDTTLDTWLSTSFSVTIPSGITGIRLLMFKGNGNKPINYDNVSVTQQTLSVKGLKKFDFETYPNPVENYLNIKAATKIDKIEIYNLLGNKVISKSINANQSQIQTSSLSTGMYILKAFIADNVGTYKLIKS